LSVRRPALSTSAATGAQTISVTLKTDPAQPPTESFTIELLSPGGGDALGTNSAIVQSAVNLTSDGWKAGSNGDWSTTSNWTSGVPGSSTQASIAMGGVVSSTVVDNPVTHTNSSQFIDLVSVTSAGVITSRYVPGNSSNTSGTLFVSSGAHLVAAIKFSGSYSAANFQITSGISGTVEITDPTVPNGGSVEPGPAQSFPRQGIDLPNIAFGAQTTLAYSQNAAGTGGTLTVSDGRHAASIALLGNYMAGSFATAADGHGGTLVTSTGVSEPMLTHPRP
jgi:hypothetical protein